MGEGRLRSGHQALDETLGGGLPGNGITVIMGLPGTGKTILAQQYTFHNARPDRPVVYFSTLSEPLEKILRFGQTLEFFDAAAIGRSVFYEDLGRTATDKGLTGVSERVATVLRERRPGLIVIDSFKALHALPGGDTDFRQFLHQLAGRLTAFPVASLWIGEYEAAEAAVSPEFAVADAILELTAFPFGQRELRSLHVRKLRGSSFQSGQHGYRLTPRGLHLFPRLADIPLPGGYQLGEDRITTGIPALDSMVGGGLWPGSAAAWAGCLTTPMSRLCTTRQSTSTSMNGFMTCCGPPRASRRGGWSSTAWPTCRWQPWTTPGSVSSCTRWRSGSPGRASACSSPTRHPARSPPGR